RSIAMARTARIAAPTTRRSTRAAGFGTGRTPPAMAAGIPIPAGFRGAGERGPARAAHASPPRWKSLPMRRRNRLRSPWRSGSAGARTPGPTLTLSRQHPVDLYLRILQRFRRGLASEHRVLNLRIECFLDARVVGERPVAGELVGVFDLRLQHGGSERIVLFHLREELRVRGDVAREHLAARGELLGPVFARHHFQELPGNVRVLRALRDAETMRVRRRPSARCLRN